jgi:hypothetical protein
LSKTCGIYLGILRSLKLVGIGIFGLDFRLAIDLIFLEKGDKFL